MLKKNSQLALKRDRIKKGFFPKLFGIKVRDTYSAIVNAQDMDCTNPKIHRRGKNRREQKSSLIATAGASYFHPSGNLGR